MLDLVITLRRWRGAGSVALPVPLSVSLRVVEEAVLRFASGGGTPVSQLSSFLYLRAFPG